MQLPWIVFTYSPKNIEHGIEDGIDSDHRVCLHQTFLNFTAELMNTLPFEQMIKDPFVKVQ